MYQAYGLLKPDSDFTLAEAAKRLAEKFPDHSVVHNDEKLMLSSKNWDMQLTLVTGPHVLQESREIEEKIGGDEDDLGIANCDRRVEVSSDVSDPEMEHFNEYLFVIEVLQSFKGIIAVDPKEPSIL
jgi:hypothetical protein